MGHVGEGKPASPTALDEFATSVFAGFTPITDEVGIASTVYIICMIPHGFVANTLDDGL
jgi:hypothetical protein